MSVSHTTLHTSPSSAGDHPKRLWGLDVRELGPGRWIAVGLLVVNPYRPWIGGGSKVSPLRFEGLGTTRRAAIEALAFWIAEFELMAVAADDGGAQ